MSIKLKTAKSVKDKDDLIVLLNDDEPDGDILTDEAEQRYLQQKRKDKKELIAVNQYQRWVFFVAPIAEDSPEYTLEAYRKRGAALYEKLKQEEVKKVKISGGQATHALALTEGLLLAAYAFSSYRKDLKESELSGLKEVSIVHSEISS